jgi:hypothetical protein
LTTQYGELITLWPSNTLNKLASQGIYPDLPTIGAARKKDKITLNKAVAQQNNRGSIASVQKAGRASERAKKRVAEEVAEEEVGERSNSEASRVVTRAAKKAKVTGGSGRRKEC